ncbi:MAG: cobalamin-binding protein [bacterium]
MHKVLFTQLSSEGVGFLFYRTFAALKYALLLGVILFLIFPPHAMAADKRIVSLAPSNTEILFALGLDEEIVGVSSYCNYPKSALSKTKVGDFSNPNIELIVSLKPDIIFAAGLEQNSVAGKLKQLGLNVVIVKPESFEELFEAIIMMGSLTGRKEKALDIVSDMKAVIREIEERVKLYHLRPRVFIEINSNPLMTSSRGSFLDEMIEMAGGINVAGDLARPYCRVSEELVIKEKPDVIIVTHTSAENILKRAGWEDIPAIKNNRVYSDINPDILVRPGPRLVLGLDHLFCKMYGGLKRND